MYSLRNFDCKQVFPSEYLVSVLNYLSKKLHVKWLWLYGRLAVQGMAMLLQSCRRRGNSFLSSVSSQSPRGLVGRIEEEGDSC